MRVANICRLQQTESPQEYIKIILLQHTDIYEVVFEESTRSK